MAKDDYFMTYLEGDYVVMDYWTWHKYMTQAFDNIHSHIQAAKDAKDTYDERQWQETYDEMSPLVKKVSQEHLKSIGIGGILREYEEE